MKWAKELQLNGKINKLILKQKDRDILFKERTSKGKRDLFCFLRQRIDREIVRD